MLFIVVVIQVFGIARITGTFRAWNLISTAFALIVVRRAIAFSAPFLAIGGFLREIVEPTVLLLITVLFIAGFYELTHIFQRSTRR